jgi:hypothetical protein
MAPPLCGRAVTHAPPLLTSVHPADDHHECPAWHHGRQPSESRSGCRRRFASLHEDTLSNLNFSIR